MSSDELEKLAAEGRARKAAASSREQEEKNDEVRTLQRYHRSVLYGSVSPYARWGWVVLAIPLGLLMAFACGDLLPPSAFVSSHDGEEGGAGFLIQILTFMFAFVLTRSVRSLVGRRAVSSEAAWIATLPFPLTNYLETLEGSASDGMLTLTLTWADSSTKDVSFVSDVFGASGATVSERAEVHTVSKPFDFESSVGTNTHVVQWIHQVAPALIALHAKWPLKRAEVKASWH